MKKFPLFLSFLLIFSIGFAQNRGFKPVSVPGATNGNLYEYSYALVIGESEYTNGWQRLNGVKSDVPEIKRALEAQGFFVVVKENIKSDDFDKTVKAFIAEYGQNVNSRVIIYYAGHGHTIKNQLTNESMGYVVPVDAPNPAYDKAGFLTKAVDMNQFSNYALQIQSKHTLFMFDACFAGTIFSGRAGVPP
ncbi:MAG: caspase family protein, partial [Bacteroidales bacterium]|nr:caspase family protein [Bacteroidales bacterium]